MNPDLPLRDIHLPEAVGWWPPAPGWWLLVVIVLVLILLLIRGLQRRRQRLSLQRSAMCELQDIEAVYASNRNAQSLIQSLSVLLRRVAISVDARDAVAGLTGRRWLDYLDSMVENPLFNNTTGEQMINAPYQADPDIDADALLAASRQWIEKVSKRGSHV